MTLILLFHQRYSRSGFLGPLVTRTETTAGRSLRLIAVDASPVLSR